MYDVAVLLALSLGNGALLSPAPSAFTGKKSNLEQSVDSYLAAAAKDRKFSGVVLVAKDGKPLFRKA